MMSFVVELDLQKCNINVYIFSNMKEVAVKEKGKLVSP